jgi:hypothetical protein
MRRERAGRECCNWKCVGEKKKKKKKNKTTEFDQNISGQYEDSEQQQQ